MELVQRAADLGALGATISGAGPSVLVWVRAEAAVGVAARLGSECAGWASVLRLPFEPGGLEVR
jgi:homoserine kinase